MDSWKIIFVLTYVLCDTKVSHQSLWPHPQPTMLEETRDENVCQSFDMCATLNGICNYGRCKTSKCTSEIYCVCDEGYTGHRCDQAVDIEDLNETKENKPLHETSSSGQLKDLTFTTTIHGHVEPLTTHVPESQIKHNSSFHKITTESSRSELLEAWITTKSSETTADNASTSLVNDGISIPSNKSISKSYDEQNKGDYMKSIVTQQSIQNASLIMETAIKDSTMVTIQSSSTSIHAKSQTDLPTTVDHTIQTISSPKTVTNGHAVFGKATIAKAVVINQSSSVVATIAVVDKDNQSFQPQFEKENNKQTKIIDAIQTEQFTTEEKTYAEVVHNNTKKESPHDGTNIYTTDKITNSIATKRRQMGTTAGYFDESNHVRTVESMLTDVQVNTSSLVGNTPEHTPVANNGNGHSNYSENTTANNGSGHSNYSENTTANNGSGNSNYSENTTANNGSGHSNYSENTTANNGSGHSNYSENTTANNGSGHSNYSENTTANNGSGHSNYSENTTAINGSGHSNYSENTTEKSLNKIIQVQITDSLLTDTYTNESTHLESTTYQHTSRDSNGVDNRNINYTTINNYLDKRHHIGTTESALTEINKETSTVVKSTTDQISITDSGRVESYNTKIMNLASLDKVDKGSLIVNNKTIKEHLSTDRTQTFGKSGGNNSHDAKIEAIVRKAMDTDQNSHYPSTQRDMEFGSYIETIGSTNHESIAVTNREKMHFESTQKLSKTIGRAEHEYNNEGDQSLQSEQDIFAADSVNEKDKSVELNERNDMTNMQYEKMESSEEEHDVIVGGRSVEMPEEVSVQKTSFKMEDIMVKNNEKSRERPSKRTKTTVRKGYYKRAMNNIFAHTSIISGHSQMEATTSATLNDNLLDYVSRTTIKIFEKNATTTESTKHAVNDMISDDKMMAVSEQNPASNFVSKREQKANISFPDLSQRSFFSGSNSSVVETITFTTHPTNQRSSEGAARYISEPVQSIVLDPSSNRTDTIDIAGVLSENTDRTSINKNDSLQQAQERYINDHQIVFSTPLDERHDHLNITNGLESMSKINITTTGSEQITDTVLVTDMFQDSKSTPVSSERFLNKSDVDYKSVIMKIQRQRSQLLQYTKMNEIHMSYTNPNVERKETSTTLDTPNDPLPQRQIAELNTISSTEDLVGTERAELFKDNSYKDGRVASEVKDMPLTSLASKLTTTKSSLPSGVLNNMSPDKSSLLEMLRRLLLLEDTFFSPSQIPYTTHSEIETHATTSKASNTYRTIGDVPDITMTTKPITSVSAESDLHIGLQTEEGQKYATQLKERHLRNESTYRTPKATTIQHEIGNQLSKPAYNKAIPNTTEINDTFTTSSVSVIHQINAQRHVNESGLSDGSLHVLTSSSFTGQPTESTIGHVELNETGSLTASMEKNSEKYVTSFDDASIHSTIIQNFIPATTLAASISQINEGQKKMNISRPRNMLDNLPNEAHVLSSVINFPASPKPRTHLVHHITEHLEGNEDISVPTGEHFSENKSYNSDQVLSSHSFVKVGESEKTTNGQTSNPSSSDNAAKPVRTEGFPKGSDSAELLREHGTIMSIEHLNRNETENNPTGSNNNDNTITGNYSDPYGSNHSIIAGKIHDSEHKVSSIKTSNAHVVSETETSRSSDIFSTLESPPPAKVTKFATSHSKIPQLSPMMNSSKNISNEISASDGEMDDITVRNKMENTTNNHESQSAETQNGTLYDNVEPHIYKSGKIKNDIK